MDKGILKDHMIGPVRALSDAEHSILQQQHPQTIHCIQESVSCDMFVVIQKITKGRFGALIGGQHQFLQFSGGNAMGTGKTVAAHIFATTSTVPHCRKRNPHAMMSLMNNSIGTSPVAQGGCPRFRHIFKLIGDRPTLSSNVGLFPSCVCHLPLGLCSHHCCFCCPCRPRKGWS